MAAVVRGVLNGIREKGLSNFLRHARDEGYFKCLLDGNLLQTKIHNIGATVVGVDKFGNKYYEKLHDTQYGRHRWVEYAEKGRYNASQVPPEWHGWLHHITDSTGDEATVNSPPGRLPRLNAIEPFSLVPGSKLQACLAVSHSMKVATGGPRVEHHPGFQKLLALPLLLEQNAKAYIVDHKENFSGEGEELIYHSKGHALNPGQRDWTRYQPWEPKKEEAT
uniref:NADH dehydrogenase [ubiquinone] 1 alpha subcomplex subunit 12 n=1 Tax=Oryza glumipatula TaxID=40148 RepID=A0A0E0BE93_9ORYZ